MHSPPPGTGPVSPAAHHQAPDGPPSAPADPGEAPGSRGVRDEGAVPATGPRARAAAVLREAPDARDLGAAPDPGEAPAPGDAPAHADAPGDAPAHADAPGDAPAHAPGEAPNMREVVGRDDILLVTLDTLRYDVARRLAAEGRIPHLAAHLPGGAWERRHAPGSFTYASHQAMFAGFLPTPASPGPHPRLFAARFAGSESTAERTWVFDTPDLVSGLAGAGYRTVCVGGVGFFNRRDALGSVLPGMFQEAHWEPSFGVASPTSFEEQVACAEEVVARLPVGRRLFLFVNVSALHQPNWFHARGASAADGDSVETHAAALEYVDRHIGRLFDAMRSRRRCFAVVCSDHGTTYGDGGYTGHRLAHDAVWTVPYAHFFLEQDAPAPPPATAGAPR